MTAELDTSMQSKEENMKPITSSPTFGEEGLLLKNISFQKKDKKILSNISCFFPAGQLTCICGSSGGGKSSLLDILAKRVRSKKEVSGEIIFKGKPLSRKTFQRVGGYVHQEDVLLPTDSIHEALMEAAFLKYKGESGTDPIEVWKRRSDRTFEIEKEMGLYEYRNVKIGGGSMGNKGASGGQRRRTSIAIQLINDPDLLLLDEYSSGLDSYTAYQIGNTLRTLAHEQRKTIVATIHQPSSAMFALFDNAMLLAKGKLIYFGPVSHIRNYFDSVDYPMPENTNPADWLITVVSDPFLRQSNGNTTFSVEGPKSDTELVEVKVDTSTTPESPETVKQTKEKLAAEIETLNKRIDWLAEYYANSTGNNKLKSSDSFMVQSITESSLVTLGEKSASEALPIIHKPKQSVKTNLFLSCLKFIVLLYRHARTTVRDPLILFSELIQVIFEGLFTGLLYLNIGNNQQSIADRIASLFFLLACASFAPAASVVAAFPQQRALFTRERESNLYGTLNYYLSYSLVHLFFETLFPIIMFICAYWLIGYQNQADTFFIMLSVLVLVQWFSESFGLLMGALFKTTDVGNLVVSVFMTIWMAMGGFFIRNDQIGGWFYPLSYTSFFRYSLMAMSQAEFDQMKFTCAATANALSSLNVTSVCSLVSGSTIDVFVDSHYQTIPLEPYREALCSSLNWNETVASITGYSCYQTGQQVIDYYFADTKNVPLWGNILILIGMIIILRVLIYLGLRFRKFGK